MEKTKQNKWLYVILSIAIAIALWAYVGKVQNPERTTTIRNIPVTFVGEDILQGRGLMISTGADQTVSLTISGRQDALARLSADTVAVSVNVSSIEQTGEYTLSYEPSYTMPSTVSGSSLVVTGRHPLNINFTVAKLAKRSIPVKGIITGSVAEGYQSGEFSFSPSELEIWGEESVVNQVDYAQVALAQNNMSEVYSGELPFTLVNYDGTTVESGIVDTGVPLIRTTLPIVQLKEVELAVNIIPGGGATEMDIQYEINPKTIMVAGAAADLEGMDQIYLGSIDLAKVISSGTIRFPISLSPELTNVSGMAEAAVDITINGLVTRTLEVDNISFINKPAGTTPEAVTQSRQVQIRGKADAVAAVTQDQLRIVADLGQALASTGTQTLPVKVMLNSGEDVGVVGDYNIVVSITK